MHLCKLNRQLLRAERTGDWYLHLATIKEMIPVFAATGHSFYAKTSQIYLQRMADLEISHPTVHEMFLKGHHVVRKSDRYWAGQSTDLVIEQSLMRALKTSGGLTRGTGFNETQRQIWLMSRPLCLEASARMQELTGVLYTTSEQHKEISTTRVARDTSDIEAMLQFLRSRNPFDCRIKELHNITTGLVADNHVNSDQVNEVGNAIISGMIGQSVVEYTFKKCNQIKNMASNRVKVGRDEVSIDPQILFQRFLLCGLNDDQLAEAFGHELCSYPAALFEAKGAMLEADKPSLADAIWNKLSANTRSPTLPENPHYVIDGGWLLHRIPWSKKTSYADICMNYVRYLRQYPGCTVVFDGYEVMSTKDCTHKRRTGGCKCTDILVEPNLTLDVNKEYFLSNQMNKQRLVRLLSTFLVAAGHEVHHAPADA